MTVLQNAIQKNVMMIFGLLLACPLIAFGIAAEHYYIGIAIAGLILILLFLMKFEIIFPLLLIARSSLDIFTDIGFEIGPMNFNIPAVLSIFINIAGLLYLALLFHRKKTIPFNGVAKAFLIWLLSLLFWAYWAYLQFGENGLLGLREWTRLFSLFVIFLLSLQLVRVKGYKYLVNCSLLSLFIPLSVGYYQIFSNPGFSEISTERIYGTLAHPNSFSLYLILFIAILIWKLKFSQRKLLWIGLLSILLFALINTFSIGGVVMISVLIILIVHREFEMKMKFLVLLLLFLFIILFINTETGQKRIEELKTTPSFNEVVKGEVITNSITWRVVNWKSLYERWTDKPWLGYGLSMSGFVNPWYMVAPHNDYLRFLVELGLLGFIITLWFLTRVWLNLKMVYKSCTDDQQKYLAMIMSIVFIAWMVGATVDNYITTTTFQFYFWALLSCAITKPEDVSVDEKSTDNHILSD